MKRFIKNNLKVFVSIIVTTIIVGSVSVYAASQYYAKDISFTPTNENFKKENGEPIENVEEALNQLYSFDGFQLIKTETYVPSGSTINVNNGSYVVIITVSPVSVINGEIVSDFKSFTSAYQVGIASYIYKATSNNMTISVDGGWQFGYYEIKG